MDLHNSQAQQESRSLTTAFSELKVTAPEFNPSVSAPKLKAPPPGFPTAVHSFAHPSDNYDYDKYDYDNYHNNYDGGSNNSTDHQLYGSNSAEDELSACMSVLMQNFPEYSPAALQDIFYQCGQDITSTIDLLYQLENEIHASSVVGTGKVNTAAVATPFLGKAPNNTKEGPREFRVDDKEEFPTLGGGGSSGKSYNAANAAVGSLWGSSNYAVKAKAAAHLPAPSANKTTTTHNIIDRRAPRPSASSSVSSAVPSSSTSAQIWNSGVQKFSTGAQVAADYAETRSDARDHARLRNACFQQATLAYVSGNRALAKELGAKGRWHNEQMKAAHAVAASDTFHRRNADMMQGGSGAPTIDLHGLHVREALDFLQDSISSLQNDKHARSVRIVVGVGQHGKVPARLPQSVRNWLEERGFKYSMPYNGLLDVEL